MNEFPLTPLQPDEALYAFLDGELEPHHEQPLFDELAAQPDLRTEMKDLLAIRNAVHRDAVFPPPQSDTGLAPLPLVGAAGATTTAATAVASTRALWPSIMSGVAGVALGAAIMAYLLTSSTPTAQQSSGGIAGEQRASAAAPAPERIVVVDTVVVTRRVATNVPPVEYVTPSSTSVVASMAPTDDARDDASVEEAQSPTIIDPVQPLSTIALTIPSAHELNLASTIAQPSAPLPVRLGFRSLASGLPSSEAAPNSVQTALLPNTAFSLTIPLASDHRIGVEMGSESFRQTFTGFDGYRNAEWIQTPVLFWLGATYIFEPLSLEFLPGLRPYGNASVGTVFAQGPIARGTVGLAYQPIGPIRFTVGVDGAALMYSFQGSWFTSTKLGLSYGLSIDMGGWK